MLTLHICLVYAQVPAPKPSMVPAPNRSNAFILIPLQNPTIQIVILNERHPKPRAQHIRHSEPFSEDRHPGLICWLQSDIRSDADRPEHALRYRCVEDADLIVAGERVGRGGAAEGGLVGYILVAENQRRQ